MAAKKSAPKAAAKKPAPKKSPPAKKAAAKPPATPRASTVAPVEMVLWHLPVDTLDPDPENPRADMDPGRLQALADNIASQGILQPLRVVAGEGGRWTIKIGHRRWRAAQLAGLTTVPCLPYVPHGDVAQLEAYIDQASENLQREDLNPLDLARFLQGLRDRYAVKVTQIPEVLGARGIEMSRSHVSNMIRLTELPDWAQDWVRDGTLPIRTARALTAIVSAPATFKAAVKTQIERYREDEDRMPSDDELRWLYHEAAGEAGYGRPERAYGDRDTERCHYDVDKCDPAELGIIELHGERYITNVERHAELNRQAIAKQRDREAKAAAKNSSSGGGDAPAAKPLNPQQLREYLRGWVAQHIIETYLPGGAADTRDPALCRSLALWAAYDAPTDCGRDNAASAGGRAACERASMAGLGQFLARDLGDDYIRPLAEELLRHMLAESLRTVADHLGLQLASVYRIDEAFLAMHQKAQIAAMVAAAGQASEEPWAGGRWQSKKTATLREWCIEHRFELGLPASLRELWESLATDNAEASALGTLPTCLDCKCAEGDLGATIDLLDTRFPDDQETEKTILDIPEVDRAALWHVVDRRQRVGICAQCWDVLSGGDTESQLEQARLLQAYQDAGGSIPMQTDLEPGDREPTAADVEQLNGETHAAALAFLDTLGEPIEEDSPVDGRELGDVVGEMAASGVRGDWQP